MMATDQVRIKVLKPIRQGNGMVRYPGEMIAMPEELVREFEATACVKRCDPLPDDKTVETKASK